MACSGEEQEILREATFWLGERRSVHLSHVAEVMAPEGRLLSDSMLDKLSVSSGLKLPVHGTNLNMRLYFLGLIAAVVPSLDRRKYECSSANTLKRLADYGESKSMRKAPLSKICRPRMVVLGFGVSSSGEELGGEAMSSNSSRVLLRSSQSFWVAAGVRSLGTVGSSG